jgi:hypothetical protein
MRKFIDKQQKANDGAGDGFAKVTFILYWELKMLITTSDSGAASSFRFRPA